MHSYLHGCFPDCNEHTLYVGTTTISFVAFSSASDSNYMPWLMSGAVAYKVDNTNQADHVNL